MPPLLPPSPNTQPIPPHDHDHDHDHLHPRTPPSRRLRGGRPHRAETPEATRDALLPLLPLLLPPLLPPRSLTTRLTHSTHTHAYREKKNGRERGEKCALCARQKTQISPSHKSNRQRAYAQHLVATRLLDCLHDPAGQLSRMQRIRPRALSNCNPPAGTHVALPRGPHRRPARVLGRSLFVSVYERAGRDHPFPAWILT